jgi:hypothetical protein
MCRAQPGWNSSPARVRCSARDVEWEAKALDELESTVCTATDAQRQKIYEHADDRRLDLRY